MARKGRSFLTILGIVIGVAGVVVIIALGAGAQSLVLGQVSKLGSNIVGILPGKSNETGPPAAVFGIQIKTLTLEDAEAIKKSGRVPNVSAVAGFARGQGTVVFQDKNVDTFYTGAQASVVNIQNIEMEAGRFFTEEEEKGGAQVVVLGFSVKEQLFGSEDVLGKAIKISVTRGDQTFSVPAMVIGTIKKQGTVAFQNQDDQVYIPLSIAQKQLLGISHLQFIRAKVVGEENIKSVMADIKQLLMERHKIKTEDEVDFSVRDLADALKLLSGITDGMRMFLTLMAAISLIVGGIGIMNIMLVTVAERTREIGLRKAVGATARDIRNQFLLESSLVTLLGGVIGIVLGAFLAYLAALGARYAGYDWAYVVSLGSIAMAVGVSILTGMVFGLYPALKASKLDPIEALRYE